MSATAVSNSSLNEIARLMRRVRRYNDHVFKECLRVIAESSRHKEFRQVMEHIPRARRGQNANRPYALRLGYGLGVFGKGRRSFALERIDEITVPLAAAMEMANSTITYIYDKIIDDDEKVGGQKSLHREFGNARALLAGDALTSLARTMVLDRVDGTPNACRIVRVFEAVFLDCDNGQFLDVFWGEKPSAGVAEAELINDLRTGQFVRRCAEIGALFANADKRTLRIISDAFQLYGRAVQDANDYHDVNPESGGPGSSYGDLRLWKKTKPLIFALEMTKGADHRYLLTHLGCKGATTSQLHDCSIIAKRCGALSRAKDDIRSTIAEAIAFLCHLPPSSIRKEATTYFQYLPNFEEVIHLLKNT